MLLMHLEAALAEQGTQELFLEVRSRNESALSLYRKYGFHGIGTRPGYYHNPTDDGLIFKKRIALSWKLPRGEESVCNH